ncbi:MAG: hypothetical protein E6G42_07800 [Actinobacteria bacterium]|nr:MAG: hypothetical protein E6G42_07800 [Actinomycetota bacterium]
MTRIRRLAPSPALVVACLALVVALAGTGYAAIRLPKDSVTTVQVKDFSLLSRDFKRGQLPAGKQGPPGPAGPAGPAGAGARWALVAPSGAVIAQSGGITARHAGDGYYVLDFGSAVNGHLIFASYSRSSDDRDAPGAIRAGTCTTTSNEGDNCATGNDPRFVAVITYAAGSVLPVDHSFYVAVV